MWNKVSNHLALLPFFSECCTLNLYNYLKVLPGMILGVENIPYVDTDTNQTVIKIIFFFNMENHYFLFLTEGAACNKVPGLSQFHYMVSTSESVKPLLKAVDCF